MDSSTVPAPVQQDSDNIVCEICDAMFSSEETHNFHFREWKHIKRSRHLAQSLFGYLPDERVTCLEDLFNSPKKKGALIGMHYLKNAHFMGIKLSFTCTLCDLTYSAMCPHLLSITHKRKYIGKDFSFLFGEVERLHPQIIEKIAIAIETVEGLQMFKVAVKNVSHSLKSLPESSSTSDCSSRGTLDKIVEQLQIHGIPFINPYEKENDVSCLETESRASEINEENGTPVNEGTAPKPIPTLCSSRTGRWTYKPVEYVPSWPTAESLYKTSEHGYGGSSYQSLNGFANQSAYGPANSVSDVGQANAFEGQTWRQETGHRGAQHLHTLGMMDGSVLSLTGPTSVASLTQDTASRYGYNSVESKELCSKSSSSSGIISVLNKEPRLPTSLGDRCSPGVLPPTTSTSAREQTSQSTNSDRPAKGASMLSPDTLKVLQGRDPESVKSILNRLSEYCPELKQVNISLLVHILFESGALR